MAFRQLSTSASVRFHGSFITGLPSASVDCPVPSSVVAPELMRWMMPPAARPVSSLPVTRFTASGLQYVRTSLKICARLVSRWPKSMATPLQASFSVATTKASRMPFQSNDVFSIDSGKSPLG